MCHLIAMPAGITVAESYLQNAASWNDDGHGWAIVAGTRIIVGKSMDSDIAIAEFLATRARYSDGPALFHSRWATAGELSTFNVHPFPVGGDSQTLIAHNGILPGDAQPRKNDSRSDTHKFAQSILPHWGHLDDHGTIPFIEKWMGAHNKLVVVTANPSYRQSLYILNEKAGTWNAGVWHSNHDFQSSYVPAPKRSDGKAIGLRETGECEFCESADSVDTLHNICWRCNACLECLDSVRDCQCSVPAGLASGLFSHLDWTT